eukprot:c5792_g1_i1.p1 GENE.c5792_g1_i1~~c5792_g1_i1.p1  ORF type:complete len:264 (+),score=78.99 c5792_g1_i1:30-794(+)
MSASPSTSSFGIGTNFLSLTIKFGTAFLVGALFVQHKSRPKKLKKLKLTYFNLEGLAEKIRVACAIGGVELEDVRMPTHEWQSLKLSSKFGQLPFIELDGEKFGQSNAILRYVGRTTGLYPESPLLALAVDEILELTQDLWSALLPSLLVNTNSALTQEQKAEMIKKLRTQFAIEELPKTFGFYERQLKNNNTGFFVGNSVTIADVIVYAMLRYLTKGVLDYIPVTCVSGFPLLQAHFVRIADVPQVVEYYSKK